MIITQDEALKLANELIKKDNPYAVVYGYHIKRGINAKEAHEYLDKPIVCETKADLDDIIHNFLSKEHVTRDNPVRVTGFDVLYHPLTENIGPRARTLKIR